MNEKQIQRLEEQAEMGSIYDLFSNHHGYVAERMKQTIYPKLNIDGLEDALMKKVEKHYQSYCELINELIDQGVLDIDEFLTWDVENAIHKQDISNN